MRPRDIEIAKRLETQLLSFDRKKHSLPGIKDLAMRTSFLEQLMESLHRVKYFSKLNTRKLSARRMDPNDEMFNPLMAAVLHKRQGNFDEAFWLVFLFVHFGKHHRGGWRYVREIYGRLGKRSKWDWRSISSDPTGFRQWLDRHQSQLKRDGVPGGFGNHRKYESLSAYSPIGTGAVVESYVKWVAPPRTHQELMDEASVQTDGDPRMAFDYLYRSMKSIIRFGRTARFDYLAMIGKLGLAPLEPGTAYLQGATGPIKGARLLFGLPKPSSVKAAVLDSWLVELDVELKVGMQALEDALCNWQKSPIEFKPFRG